ncbi:serine protease FAM111A-like [Mustelus asterias]
MLSSNDSTQLTISQSSSQSDSEHAIESSPVELLTDPPSEVNVDTKRIKCEYVPQVESQCRGQLPTEEPCHNGEGQNLPFKFSLRGDIDSVRYAFFGKSGDSLFSALQTSAVFQQMLGRYKPREVVTYGMQPFQGIVSSRIPCQCLPADTYFILSFVKDPKGSISGRPVSTARSHGKRPILFYILPTGRTKGRDNRKIISCKQIANGDTNLCVLGFEGETIREALVSDGRFLPTVQSEFCYLVTIVHPITKIQFNNIVNSLSGQVFQIQINKATSEEAMTAQAQKTTTEKYATVDKKKSKLSREYLHSECIAMSEMQNVPLYMIDRNKTIISDFQKFIEKRTCGDLSQSAVVNFLKSEYKTLENISTPVKDLLMLKQKSLSVGYISSAHASGTCFILKGAYILTCYHVVEGMVGKEITNHDEESIPNVLCDTVTVIFDYEHTKLQGSSYKVKRWFEVYSKELDYAVLELEYPQGESKCLSGLLENYQRTAQQEVISSGKPQQEVIYIIGHPNGSIKKIDNSVVLPVVTEDQQMVQRIRDWMKSQLDLKVPLEESLQTMYLLSKNIMSIDQDRQRLKYDTCFFHGSSGSPVLSSNGEVVAMHCAGVGQPCFLFEYGTAIVAVKYDVFQKHPNFYQNLLS